MTVIHALFPFSFDDSKPQLNVYEQAQLDAVARQLYQQVDALERPSLRPVLIPSTDSLDLGTLS